MNRETLLCDVRDHVLWVTVNRPDKLNALNRQTISDLGSVFADDAQADDVWAVVITGAGGKAFVAGADIAELNTLGPIEAREFARAGQEVFSAIEAMAKPVVAVVNGFALGGGCELAMSCHLRVAAETAVFGQPEVKLGLIPGFGGTQRLPRLVGRGRALEMILSGRNVTADEALAAGLVNRVCAPAELEATVGAMLEAMLANGPHALGACIEAVNRGQDLPMAEALALEADLFAVGAASPEMTEGTAAFLEKRRARFRPGGE
jgi:enoyl-CoA hydratase